MQPLLYGELVPWYGLLDPCDDHAPDVKGYQASFEHAVPGAQTLLELGSGAGNNAFHFKATYRCTLAELSEPMLGLSRAQNPECEHVQGDMRTLRLASTFDLVMVHDAVMYMTSRADLLAAMKTAFAHLRPGGAVIFAPDCVRETFEEMTELEAGDDLARSLRCTMWTWDPDPQDDTYRCEFAFLLREGGTVRAVHDTHVEGVFSRAVWVELLREAGFSAVEVRGAGPDDRPLEHFLAVR